MSWGRRKLFGGLVLAFVALIGCGRSSGSETTNVFNRDNRETVFSHDYPWSAIGRLDSGCTGTLVGRRLVLTAAHCVYDSKTKAVKKAVTYFRPNLVKNESKDPTWVEEVWIASKTPEDDRGRDWALLRLAKPVGDTYKWLVPMAVNFGTSIPYTTNLVGYSADRDKGETASVHRGCYILSQAGDRLLHDCDGTAGVSGGPMIDVTDGKAKIIAIAVSEYRGSSTESLKVDRYSSDVANVAISVGAVTDSLNTLRRTVDADQTAPDLEGMERLLNPNVPGAGDLGPTLPDPSANGNGGNGNGNGGNGNGGNGNGGNGNGNGGNGNGNGGNGNGNGGNGDGNGGNGNGGNGNGGNGNGGNGNGNGGNGNGNQLPLLENLMVRLDDIEGDARVIFDIGEAAFGIARDRWGNASVARSARSLVDAADQMLAFAYHFRAQAVDPRQAPSLAAQAFGQLASAHQEFAGVWNSAAANDSSASILARDLDNRMRRLGDDLYR